MATTSHPAAPGAPAEPAVEGLLAELKAASPAAWMAVTNARGELAARALRRWCLQQHVAALGGEGELRGAFRQLCGEEGCRGALSLEAWLAWPWLGERLGPPGTEALLTPEAARGIWARVVATGDGQASGLAGEEQFVELARAVERESARATAIQSALRGLAGRRRAGRAQSASEEVADRIPEAPVLAPFNPTPDCAVAQALDALAAGPGDVVFDLGCGDGRLLLAAARRGATGVGVEYDRRFVDRARGALASAGLAEAVRVIHADACSVD
ncbi:unnamed protein product [Prorocentrum cordatum]|uniref:Methyltransferase domain-containing protein n=2 Tax=Prorocentrum cordatum TaxID=2364126 RepID=A0ABN9VY52_9DINO|nr:unnamed protein product [Polarella glacialis]